MSEICIALAFSKAENSLLIDARTDEISGMYLTSPFKLKVRSNLNYLTSINFDICVLYFSKRFKICQDFCNFGFSLSIDTRTDENLCKGTSINDVGF